MKRIFSIFVFSITAIVGQSNVATTAGSFLEIGAGARAIAMGSAFVAVSDDVSALYWNPAGIVEMDRPTTHVYHSPWLVETNYYHGGAVIPMGYYGSLGLSYSGVTMDEMMVRTVENPEGTGEKFSVSNVALGISYAKRLTDRFSFGIKAKMIQEKIWQMHAKGISIDIGSIFVTSSGLKIGMSVSNFGGKLQMEGTNTLVDFDLDETIYGNNDRIDAHLDAGKWPLPIFFRFGLAKEYSVLPGQKILLALDGIHPNNNVEYVNAGMEYNLNDILFVRIGQSHIFMNEADSGDKAEQGLSFGVGLNYQIPRGPKIRVDYVQTDFGVFNSVSGYSINFSF
jgi:hypothetical protein